MPVKNTKTLSAWSYSVYTQYCKCPHSVFLEKIQRVHMPEEKNVAMERGSALHKGSELYVGSGGRAPALHPELKGIKPRLDVLRKLKARVEQEWAFTRAWLPTGWFSSDCWLRIKVDAVADTKEPPTVTIVDYKTGKIHEEHKQQRSLYGLGGLQLVQIGKLASGDKNVELTAEHVYIDGGATATQKYKMKDLEPLKREWLTRTKQMMADTRFPVQEGFHCRWCRFAKSKGGPCPANQ